MCFSATASFTAASFATTAGIFTLSRATRVRDLPLAGTPLLFGAQQAIEGALWLALPHSGDAVTALVLANGFAVIALVVWPLYAPVAASLGEDDAKRRAWIMWLLPLGCSVRALFGL